MYCTTLVRSKSRGIGDGLTYDAGEAPVAPGTLVRVPLRKQKVEGIVIDLSPDAPPTDFTVKAIEGMLGHEPLLSRAQIMTLRWMASYYLCTLRQAIGVFLPSQPWSALLPRETIGYRAAVDQTVRGKRQRAALEYLSGKDWVSRDEWRQATGVSAVTIRALLEKGVIIERKKESPRASSGHPQEIARTWTLTAAQRAAAQAIRNDARPALLFGVTGSGKTMVYAELIADALSQGKQAILLLPEILLTQQSISRFEELIGPESIAVLHSRLTPSDRRSAWRRIQSGTVALVVGSRSALFAPCPRLGLVVIDEEHEWTYKNEQTPRYHVRETAEILCASAGAKLVLGSATPSVESWSRAKASRYNLVRLPDRFSTHAPARVRVIDLAHVRFGDSYPFSPPLLEAIRERLRRGEQSVLFLNRRGMASSLLCLQCRRRVLSPASQMPYTVHRTAGGRPFLLDHASGDTGSLPATCPACGAADLRLVGAGTQRLEDILAGVFPEARVLRADSDVLSHPEQMRKLLGVMEQRRADILIGTQSVVKGLHLPGVTLAAVLIADIGLSLPHFRAGERVFQLLMQLTGRSGREEPGDVIIQTFRPSAPEILAAATGNTKAYLDAELAVRQRLGYPPAAQMLRIIVTGNDASSRAKKLHALLRSIIERESAKLHISVAPTLFGGGRVWHILLRGEHPRSVLNSVDLSDVVVDVDPMECM